MLKLIGHSAPGTNPCLQIIIDGQALIVSIGMSANALTFGDLADVFIKTALHMDAGFIRIEVVVDQYVYYSIKSGTRSRRSKSIPPVRCVVEGHHHPLPKPWSSFLALPENKADLSRFMSEQILSNGPPQIVLMAASRLS